MTNRDRQAYAEVQPETRRFLQRPQGLIIGDRIDLEGSGSIEVIDPATAEVVTSVAEAQEQDIDFAVETARQAFSTWSEAAPQVRERAMIDIAEIIEGHVQELAELEVIDTGKPLRNARGEVALAASVFRYYAGWSTRRRTTSSATRCASRSVSAARSPRGTTHFCSRPGRWRQPSRSATPSSSSPRSWPR